MFVFKSKLCWVEIRPRCIYVHCGYTIWPGLSSSSFVANYSVILHEWGNVSIFGAKIQTDFSSLDCRYYFGNGIVFGSIWQANYHHLFVKCAHYSLFCDGFCFQLHDVCDSAIFRRRLNPCCVVSILCFNGGIGAFVISSKFLWRSFEFWMEYRISMYDIFSL